MWITIHTTYEYKYVCNAQHILSTQYIIKICFLIFFSYCVHFKLQYYNWAWHGNCRKKDWTWKLYTCTKFTLHFFFLNMFVHRLCFIKVNIMLVGIYSCMFTVIGTQYIETFSPAPKWKQIIHIRYLWFKTKKKTLFSLFYEYIYNNQCVQCSRTCTSYNIFFCDTNHIAHK